MGPRASRRWLVLAAFVLAALVTQLLWLDFAPILVDVEKRYAVSEGTASLLLLPFPLLYVLLSLPAGRLVDRLGYRRVVGLGTVVTAAGAAIRLDADHFASLVAGQLVVSVAQPFVVNGISKLVDDWFPADEAALATGLGTVGMFLGMAVGMASTPPLVDAFGMRGCMLANFAVAFAAVAVWYTVVRERAAPSSVSSSPVPAPASWGALLRNRRLLVLSVLSFLGMGYFNGLTTWLEQLLAPRGIDANKAGVIGGAIIVGGIVGAVVIPLVADKLRRRKLPLLACAAVATALNGAMAVTSSSAALTAEGVGLGFAFLPAFALLLAMTSEVVEAKDAGAATAVVMLAGNAGGVVVIVLLAAIGDWAGPGGFGALVAVTVVMLVAAFAAPETHPSRA